MISKLEAQEIASGWISEYSLSIRPTAEREREYFFKLDDLIYHNPDDSLVVLYEIAQMRIQADLLEGFAAGPLRTFIMLYDKTFECKINKVLELDPHFKQMYILAKDGIA